MKLNFTFLELVIFAASLTIIIIWLKYGKRLRRWWKEWRKQQRGPRQLRPRSPEDCPKCNDWLSWLPRRPRREVVPWSQKKSPRGRKKEIDTTGYACLNILCDYFGVTDAAIHALVGDGMRGVNKDILYLRCQCCGKRKTSRAGTPMYYLKTSLHEVAMVVTALSEGVDISSATRIFGFHHSTISRWLERMGKHSERLHERLFFRAVQTGHVQLDELVSKVKLNSQHVWIWTAITAETKLIFAVHIGGRSIADACSLVHQVWERLVPDTFPVFTSDGLNQYFYGLTAHFGFWDKPPRARKFHWFPNPKLVYAQIRKIRSGYKLRFIKSIIRLGDRADIRERLKQLGCSGRIQTSYIERSNLTLRELIAPLSRRTWSLAHGGVFILKTPTEKSGEFLHIISGCISRLDLCIIISFAHISHLRSGYVVQAKDVIELRRWRVVS